MILNAPMSFENIVMLALLEIPLQEPLLFLSNIRVSDIALGNRLIRINGVHRSLILLGNIRSLVGILVIHKYGHTNERGKEHGEADAEQRCVAPVVKWRLLSIRQLNNLDVPIRRDLNRLRRVRDRIDRALPLPQLLAGAVVDQDVRVLDLQEGVLEWEHAVELHAGNTADEAGVGPHCFVAADEQVAGRVEDHVDVRASREVE